MSIYAFKGKKSLVVCFCRKYRLETISSLYRKEVEKLELQLLQIKDSAGITIDSPDMVAEAMSQEAKADRECFWVLHLTNGNRIIEKELISIGTLNSSLVHVREVFKKAIVNGAAGIITVHNHPSGNVKPSKEDTEIWRRLNEAGELLGIEVMDHIIITPDNKLYSERANKKQREVRKWKSAVVS
jgi:DNA repair protein RadC